MRCVMDKMEKYKEYAKGVINGDIVCGEYIKLACERYLSWFQRDDIFFDSNAVDRVINFISKLKHFTGQHANKPFTLQPWQFNTICNIFGWKWKHNNTRVIKNVYIEIARKNGKSAFASAICLYCLIGDNEPNAEVELIANSRKQASICFNMCSNFVSTLCGGRKNKYFKLYRDKIDFTPTKSMLQVLSSDANNNDGWNSSTYICDEYHSHANSQMFDVMKSSQGMRTQPLSIVITTAGFNLFSPCYEMRKTNIEILQGIKNDDTQFSAIYALDEGDEWDNKDCWIKANPNLNITVKEQYLTEQVQQAKNNTSMEVSVRTKNFNQWLSSSSVWITQDKLNEISQPINLNDFNGYVANMGVDLSAVGDLTALSVMIEKDDKYYFKNYYYAPSIVLTEHPNAHIYKQWYKQGFLNITNGNTTDYDYITNDIKKINKTIYINQIAYDKWNAQSWAVQMTSEGLPIAPFSQALWNFNKPTKELERLIKSDKVIIDDNPITRWCFANCVLKFDHNENCKPIKEQINNKIDGVIAMIMALGIVLSTPQYNNQIMAL